MNRSLFGSIQIAMELRDYIALTRFVVVEDVVLLSNINKMIELEMKIANILVDSMTIEESVQVMTLKDLDHMIDSDISADKIDIILALKNSVKRTIGHSITEQTKILVPHKSFFNQINSVLHGVPTEDLVNYLTFSQIVELSSQTTQFMRDWSNQFQSAIGGSVDLAPRYT
jgi:hypothetical protein